LSGRQLNCERNHLGSPQRGKQRRRTRRSQGDESLAGLPAQLLRRQSGVMTYAIAIDREHQQVCLTGQACQQVEMVLDAAVVM
jgi:hypothetical protein